jgi:RNA polymerase sigma factor (sigma-70 family)
MKKRVLRFCQKTLQYFIVFYHENVDLKTMISEENREELKSHEVLVYEFQKWIEHLIPVRSVIRFIKSRGFHNEVPDICAKYCIKLDQVKKQVDSITKSYARKTLSNLVKDEYRQIAIDRQKKDDLQRESSNGVADSIQGSIEQEEEKEKILKLVEFAISQLRLGLRERVIIKLYTYPQHQFTFKEIANIVGYSESTARVEYHRYLAHIRTYVKQKMSKNEYLT